MEVLRSANLRVWAAVLAAALLLLAVTGAALGGDRLVLLDGRSLEGTVQSIDAEGRVRLAGRSETVDLQGLRSIDRGGAVQPDADQAPCDVFLVGGGVLRAHDLMFDGSAFAVDWAYGTEQPLPLAAVRAVRLGRGTEEDGAEPSGFQAARTDAEARRDELFALVDGRVQVVRGALQHIDPSDVQFIWNDATRRVARSKVYGVVLARSGPAPDHTGQCLVRLEDGSSFWMTVRSLEKGRLTGAVAGGAVMAVPWSAVARLQVRSRRMVFLSDLDPVEVDQQPLVTFAGPWRRDRNVVGGPLTLGDRVYEKGLGVHSRCRLVYDLGGRYDVFAATIGVDASAGGRGDCVFKVHADDKELLAKRMTGAGKPHTVRLPIKGASRLALTVEWGEDMDLADRADWCDARLLKETSE